jgi:hypothetical protein
VDLTPRSGTRNDDVFRIRPAAVANGGLGRRKDLSLFRVNGAGMLYKALKLIMLHVVVGAKECLSLILFGLRRGKPQRARFPAAACDRQCVPSRPQTKKGAVYDSPCTGSKGTRAEKPLAFSLSIRVPPRVPNLSQRTFPASLDILSNATYASWYPSSVYMWLAVKQKKHHRHFCSAPLEGFLLTCGKLAGPILPENTHRPDIVCLSP